MSTTTEYIIFKPTEIENSLRANGANMQSQRFIRFDWSFFWTRLVVSSITIDEQILSSYLNTESNPATSYERQYPWSPAAKKYVDDSVSWAVSKWSTAPSSPTEWQLWYDTTNDVLKVYDGTQWNVVWDDAADINTKTFYLSGTSDLTNAQAAYDWYVAGKNPIVVYWTEKPISTVYDTSNWLRFRSSDSKKSTGTSSSMINYWKMLSLVVSNWNVTSISVWDYTGNAISVLATWQNYSTPYTPQYDGSPATKKYVDDNAWIQNDTTWTTSTIDAEWVWTDAEFKALSSYWNKIYNIIE